MIRSGAGGARVIYPDATGKNKPQLELRYEYGAGGQLIRVSAVDMTSASLSTYGPERYVIEYSYDEAGRLVRKCVRANQVEDSAIQYESDYQYDGRGQLVRERIFRWDSSAEQMKVTQDVEYTYDLGRNVTTVKLTDDKGWVYTETRSYARGYQLTDFSESHASGVTLVAIGAYTYDTNNNMTGTKSFEVYRTGTSERLAYRAQWTFTFDRKNRVASHTNQETDLVRHLWWDGLGRVWQRWNHDPGIEAWDSTVTRYVYDGALAQEHLFDVSSPMGEWIYAYSRLTHDYLRQPAGIRDRVHPAQGSDTDYFLLSDMGTVAGRFTRGASVSLSRAQHDITGDRQARYAGEGGEPDGGPFVDVSNLGFASSFIESYGGSKVGDAQFFDALNQFGSRHYLPGLGTYVTRRGNNPYNPKQYLGDTASGQLEGWEPVLGGGDPDLPYVEPACACFYAWEAVDWVDQQCPWCTLGPLNVRREDWFKFCCAPNCLMEKPGGPALCPDPELLSNCHCDHCEWSFGLKGNMTYPQIDEPSCKEWVPDIIAAFEQVCSCAPSCACATWRSDGWKERIAADSALGITYRSVWGCISSICRKGGISVRCYDCDNEPPIPDWNARFYCCTSGSWGTRQGNRVTLCRKQILESGRCIANVLLHEMLHVCGVTPEAESEKPPTEEGDYSDASATHFIADHCIDPWDCECHPPTWYDSGCYPCEYCAPPKVLAPCR